jgi:hypothetical protein
MTVDQFRSVVKKRPFVPLTIRMTSGEAYPANHPESLWQSPGGRTVIIYIKGEEVVMIDVSLISEVAFSTKRKTTTKE